MCIGFWSCYVRGSDNVELCATRGHWRNGPGNKVLVGAESFFRRRRRLGMIDQCFPWTWGDYSVCPKREEITPRLVGLSFASG